MGTRSSWGQEWESALRQPDPPAEPSLATPHPAVGASGAEAALWEAALGVQAEPPARVVVAAVECG
jgi:hypothetical protein